MSIDAKVVKALRERTGAGMMDCKKALEESGGNVEGSQPDEIIIRNGVKIIGVTNLASKVAGHASLALSNNYNNWITDFFDEEKSKLPKPL